MVDLRFFILKFWLVDFFLKTETEKNIVALLATCLVAKVGLLLWCFAVWEPLRAFAARHKFVARWKYFFPDAFFFCCGVCALFAFFWAQTVLMLSFLFFLHCIVAVLFCRFCAFLALLPLPCVSFCVAMLTVGLYAFFLCVFASPPPIYMPISCADLYVCGSVFGVFCCARFALLLPCFPHLPLLITLLVLLGK